MYISLTLNSLPYNGKTGAITYKMLWLLWGSQNGIQNEKLFWENTSIVLEMLL